jgi:Tol biopolymer transport system component
MADSIPLATFVEPPGRTSFEAVTGMSKKRVPVLLAAALLAGLCLFATPAQSAFPGGNGKIAFQSDRDGNNEIYTMNADGTGQTRRTTNATSDNEPAWSADGALITFHSSRDGNAEVYTMNADGTGQTNRTANAAGDGQAGWAPDRGMIAFNSDRDGNFEIYTMNTAGQSQTRRTFNAADDTSPVWTPDSSLLAFQSNRDGNYEIYLMGADGIGQARLTNNAAQDADPAWSPDGTKIAFTSNRDGNFDVYTMNADGTGQTRRTTNAATDAEPAWSPDGTKIAFVSSRDGNFEIYTMNVDGTGQTRRTTNTAADLYPDWQPQSYQHSQNTVDENRISVALVPAFRQTISATQCSARGGTPGQHTAPFAVGSCDPPAPVAGTSAWFGADGTGRVIFSQPTQGNPTTPADEADYAVSANLSDIRLASLEGADYTPDLRLLVLLRVSDKNNCAPSGCSGPFNRPGTAADVTLTAPIDCTSTADPAIGSNCAANTSADALTPGAVVEARQTVINVFRVRVNDAGFDGFSGNADDKLFAQQGTYIP